MISLLTSIIIKHKGKVITFALVGSLTAYLLLKKKPAESFENKTVSQKKAYLVAIQIKSALNVQTGFWGWTEDEKAVIKAMNENISILPDIEREYKKLTGNALFNDISKYLSPSEIAQIKSPLINSKLDKYK